MSIITIDFETYYDKQFSLSKMTTEEYVRSDQFEVIGMGIKIDDGKAWWVTDNDIIATLNSFDWSQHAILCHNTMFDGAILSWLYGIKPKVWLDTLCMARAIHGVEAGGSLKALAERYELGVKGDEVINALGKRRVDFSDADLDRYGAYCRNDVDLTYNLFLQLLKQDFPKQELKVIDTTLRMFIEPTLELDLPGLESHLENVKAKKAALLAAAEADRDLLMSNDKFAELLGKLGVEAPKKVSARTGKETWAFAKTDEEFKALLEHPDPRVQMLVSARLGVKTTLEETRTQRFIDIALRGKLPVPIRYYAAHTGRWGGDDKINLQNLPSRGSNAGRLKSSITAPEGHVIIDSDSSQIEARTVAWLAGQEDLNSAFTNGEDVYKIMASAIYAKPADEITKAERFVGKTTVLGAGYGMGAVKFQMQLKTFGVDVDLDECKRIIDVYRKTYPAIPALWKQGQRCIESIITGNSAPFGAVDAVKFDPR
jgi:DNA polymerase